MWCYKLLLANIEDINYVCLWCLLAVWQYISSSILVMINSVENFNYVKSKIYFSLGFVSKVKSPKSS